MSEAERPVANDIINWLPVVTMALLIASSLVPYSWIMHSLHNEVAEVVINSC